MQDARWDGLNNPDLFTAEGNRIRQKLADAAKGYKWKSVLKIIEKSPHLVNATRPGGGSLYAPLHQAASGSAPPDVIEALLNFGAWRTLQNAYGERPVDIAERKRNERLAEMLEPATRRNIPWGILLKIQHNFHEVIRDRIEGNVETKGLRLPELEPVLEYEDPMQKFWFAVPGMYGGFAYWFERDGANAELVAESWCRVVGGSGQRHEIGTHGSKLVAEGFV